MALDIRRLWVARLGVCFCIPTLLYTTPLHSNSGRRVGLMEVPPLVFCFCGLVLQLRRAERRIDYIRYIRASTRIYRSIHTYHIISDHSFRLNVPHPPLRTSTDLYQPRRTSRTRRKHYQYHCHDHYGSNPPGGGYVGTCATSGMPTYGKRF